MPRYIVIVKEVIEYEVEIEAVDRVVGLEAAKQMIANTGARNQYFLTCIEREGRIVDEADV